MKAFIKHENSFVHGKLEYTCWVIAFWAQHFEQKHSKYFMITVLWEMF